MTIVCTGSIAYDYLMTFPGYFKDHILQERLDCISLSFLVDSMVRQRGGTAPNIAYTLALLGDRPLVFGTVGEDFEDYRTWLESKHVDTTFARLIPGVFTASFFCNTDRSNAQIASFYPGAMGFASQLSLAELTQYKVDMVVISPNDPQAMDRCVRECQQMGLPYLYDPSQQVVRVSGEELRRGVQGAYSLFCNEYEFELLQKHTGFSADEMRSLVKILVVTLGDKGASIFTAGQEITVPVVPAREIVDPTGVGDAFRGGFLRGWQLGLDWATCGQMGALAATYVLEQRGPQSHSYTLPEFVARYRQHFNDHGALDVLTR